MEKRRHTRISAYAILVQNDSLLLCRCSSDSDIPGQWTLPGGGIEFGEDPAMAAVREVKEETGFDVVLGEILTIDSRLYVDETAERHAIRIIYAARIVGGKLTLEVGGSTDACEWILFDEVSNYPLTELARVGVQFGLRRHKGV